MAPLFLSLEMAESPVSDTTKKHIIRNYAMQ